jgi:hypothetical protein
MKTVRAQTNDGCVAVDIVVAVVVDVVVVFDVVARDAAGDA